MNFFLSEIFLTRASREIEEGRSIFADRWKGAREKDMFNNSYALE